MKKQLITIFFTVLSFSSFSQAVDIVFHPNQVAWFQKRNFPSALYDFKDEAINKYLRKSLRLRNTNTGVIVSGVPLFFIFWPSVAGVIPLSLQLRGSAISNLNIATSRWLINNHGGQVYQGDESFRRPNNVRWYRKENFLVEYYHGGITYVNGMLEEAFKLRQRSNALYWAGGISGVVGPIVMIAGIIQAFSSTNSTPYLLVVGTGITLASPISLISGLVMKGRSRKLLTEASSHWYSDLSK